MEFKPGFEGEDSDHQQNHPYHTDDTSLSVNQIVAI